VRPCTWLGGRQRPVSSPRGGVSRRRTAKRSTGWRSWELDLRRPIRIRPDSAIADGRRDLGPPVKPQCIGDWAARGRQTGDTPVVTLALPEQCSPCWQLTSGRTQGCHCTCLQSIAVNIEVEVATLLPFVDSAAEDRENSPIMVCGRRIVAPRGPRGCGILNDYGVCGVLTLERGSERPWRVRRSRHRDKKEAS